MILPPLPTPFTARGDLDREAFKELVQRLEPEVDGLLLYGSNGEGVLLAPEERREGLEVVSTAKPLLVGIMEESLPQARRALEEAASVGAQEVLVTPPRYYAAHLGGGLKEYYLTLADTGGPELWLYHVPQNTHVDLPLAVVAELAAHPRVVGIKDSSGELARIAFYVTAQLPLRIYTGHAPTFLGALALGAQGGILAAANLAPRAYRALLQAVREGDFETARRLQGLLEPLGRLLNRGGVVLLKQALRYLGMPAGFPRPPYPKESPWWEQLLPELELLRQDSWLIA